MCVPLPAAVPANAGELQSLAVHRELCQGGCFCHGFYERAVIGHFFSIATALTQQKITGMHHTGMRASDEGIAGSNAMHEFLFQQKPQGAIYGRRGRFVPLSRQAV